MAQNRKFQDFVETKMLKADSVTDAKTATTIEKTLKFVFDGSSLTTGAKTLTAADGTALALAGGSHLKAFYLEVDDALDSAGSATIALGHTGSAASIMAATAYDNAEVVLATAGWRFCATGGANVGGVAPSSVILTIAGANLTAGAFSLYLTIQENIA